MSDPMVLSAEWQVWLAHEILAETSQEVILTTLCDHGMTAPDARAAIDRLSTHPAMIAAKQAQSTARTSVQLRRRMRQASSPGVERRPGLDATTLRDVYAAHGVPVVMPGWCADWPAARWTPEGLAARVGDAMVTVNEGHAPNRDRHWKAHARQAAFRDVVAEVLASPDDGARYLIAQHRNLDGPLASLLADLTPDPEVVHVDRLQGNASLWFGPGGTHTPTHHDASGILLCVLYGAKRVWLAPPDARGLATGGGGYYADVQLSQPGITEPDAPMHGDQVYTVDLHAGDALYLPPCWWHEVRALSVCLHVSLVGLRWRNRYDDVRFGS